MGQADHPGSDPVREALSRERIGELLSRTMFLTGAGPAFSSS